LPVAAGRHISDDDVLPGLPAGLPIASAAVVEDIALAREITPETFGRVLNLARSRAKATLDACRADFEKGKLRPTTYERNEAKWNATIADIDKLLSLARV